MGPDDQVAASVGHIRNLPVGGDDMGIDREHGHALKYVVSDDNKSVVANLRRLAKAGIQRMYRGSARVRAQIRVKAGLSDLTF
ncbi:hypothetical protein [Hymenobacter volaticus]|uniref:Uncharacterized protein n=1 Tax=Hymenobacter volaticus TaxID=2932254 RepID=A0ABY4GEA3_9BACT|nr:hypothetical protein [Hymenobacter volaticus]UOQ69082.1 hypothetical protein MUN86_26635 [Hymenobacter volaticus]